MKDLRGDGMAKVLAAIKVNPRDENVDLNKLVEEIKEKLPSKYEVVRWDKVYVAFGLYALRIEIAMPEELEGGTYEIEQVLNKLPEVSSIDIEFVTRTGVF